MIRCMGVLGVFFGLPVLCFVGWVALLVRGPRKGLGISLAAAVATMTAGFWAITQSRASTAGIGVIFLPGAGALSGLLAFAGTRLWGGSGTGSRIVAWLCLAGALVVPAWLVAGGFQERAKNQTRDLAQIEHKRKIDDNQLKILELLGDNAGHEETALDAEIEKHKADGEFLIPALETEFVPEQRLDELSAFPDLNVVLTVARNPRTRGETLARIYRSSSYPPYFFQALAQHKNTPVEILRELADAKAMGPGGLDTALARNPSAPRDVLLRIAGSDNHNNLRLLLRNSALDCEMLRTIVPKLNEQDRNNVEALPNRTEALERELCAAK